MDERTAQVISGFLKHTVSRRGGELRLGVLCDTGESMRPFAGRTTSLAWVLICGAHLAAQRYDVHTGVRRSAKAIVVQTEPGVVPRMSVADFGVSEMIGAVTAGQTGRLDDGVYGLVRRLRLTEPGGSRLLVLITDAQAPHDVVDQTRTELARLRDSGCGVLWLCTSTAPCVGATLPGATLLIDPDEPPAARVLGAAIDAEIDRPHPDHADAGTGNR
ncbi:hypothetical protein [Pseudonocardia sp. HH130630-07]|uniref:hypothetical protein n=1 Tax=Pseudonocardia sp. HH130630-07 TaxID=1690815 RepID=UPI000814E2A5|nr:hypothetical protein [Pseudonocardia sp. HH130630-07]ANY07805.1 hypothetical protein AFB00_17570 [Pseudonocardia sp. HH130630-07]